MALSKVATSAYFLAKEYSTIFIVKTSKKLLNIKFIRRNQVAVTCTFILWVACILSAYLVHKNAGHTLLRELYHDGAKAAREISDISGTQLLENDTLSLIATIRDFSESKNIKFIAVLDHNNVIMAHTKPERIHETFSNMVEQAPIDEIEDVTISYGAFQDGEPAYLFSKNILFSGVTIGKVHYVISAADSIQTLGRYRLFFILGIGAITVFLAAILMLIDYRARTNARSVQRESEGMSRIGPYVLRKKIGQGGMAELFLADYEGQDGFRKTVALKKVLPHLLEYPEFSKMFIREARLAAILQHPNIVQVIDFKKIEKASFIAMEYIHGKNLGQLMVKVKDKLPVDLCIFLMLKISSGLYYAHSRKDDATGKPLNIIHRDICPQNLLISYQGEVKITDFGISKAQSEPSLTQAGVIKGKLSYMAPEQALGRPINHQADIYSLGVVSYEMLTGKKVNKFDSETEALQSISDIKIPPVNQIEADLPVELNQVVMKCLEANLAARYQNAKDLNNDLELIKDQYNITYDESNLAAFIMDHFKEEVELS